VRSTAPASSYADRCEPMVLGRTNIIVTIARGPWLTYLVFSVVHWAIVNAVWSLPKGVGSCREMMGHGACWVVITERSRFILFGSYPFDQQWRPLLACLLFVALFVTSSIRACWRRSLLVLWIVVPACAIALLLGGIFGLPEVPTELWGGLPLTFLLSTVGFAFAFPLAVALALGRRSEMPAIRVLSVAYIELVRGVPLIMFQIEMRDVNKWFGAFQVLRDINMKVARGERIAICGPSGSGKSTLIRCINGLEQHQKGMVIVNGEELTSDVKRIDKVRRDVGMVFQQFNLFPHLTILENCTLGPIWVKKMPLREAEDLAMHYLRRVNIAEQADKYPAQFSGGQQQRAAIARALCMSPRIMLFDEPTSALDPRWSAKCWTSWSRSRWTA
jgi:ABC-type polar amino acid transport system ATPase subunit